MPTVDATPTTLSPTATAGRTATGGVAATAAAGLDGLFAEMMAAFTKTIGLPTDPTAATTAARPAATAVAGLAVPTAAETTTDDAGGDAATRKAAETAAADLAGVMALVARGDTLRLADGGGLASPASLGARTATVSATSAAAAGLDPTRAPADRAVAASATAAGTTTAAAGTDAAALVDAAVAGARTTAAAATTPGTTARPATPQTTDTGALAAVATAAAAATGGLAAATATLAAATEARLDAAATAQAAAIARSATPAATSATTTATATAAASTTETAPAATAAATDDGLGLKSFVARRIAPERAGGDAPRSHFTAAADTVAAPATPAAPRTERLAALPDHPAEAPAPAATTTDAAGDDTPRPLAAATGDLAAALRGRGNGDTATAPVAAVDAGKPSDDEPDAPRTDDPSAAVPPTAARIATPAETIAHRPTTTATADVAAVPLAAVAEHVAARAASGTSRFTVKLDPAELGSIDVRVEVRASGEVRAHLVVERSDTLDMMLRDQKNLERSLGAAGLDVSSSGLQFSLRDQNRRDGGGDDRAPTRSTESDEIDEIAPRTTQEAAIAAYRPLRAGGLDLRI